MCAHFLVDIGCIKGNCVLLGTKFINQNQVWCAFISSCECTHRFGDSLQGLINVFCSLEGILLKLLSLLCSTEHLYFSKNRLFVSTLYWIISLLTTV